MAVWAIERSCKRRTASTVQDRREMQRTSFAATLLHACTSGERRGDLWRAVCCVLFVFLLLMASHANAARAKPSYKVDVEAEPRSLRKLLEEHLDIARFAKRDDISPEQFDFLVTATPQQVRDLASTQGYFTPKAPTTVECRMS